MITIFVANYFRIGLFSSLAKETVDFGALKLKLVLVHISALRKDTFHFLLLVFCNFMSRALYELLLHT